MPGTGNALCIRENHSPRQARVLRALGGGLYYRQLKHDNAQPPQARKCEHRDEWAVFSYLPRLLPGAEAAQKGSLTSSSAPRAKAELTEHQENGRMETESLEGVANDYRARSVGVHVCSVFYGTPAPRVTPGTQLAPNKYLLNE